MINVENLTKVYKTKDNQSIVALDSVSFKLPDQGMVFICGKSGSGKSTLLNILACLDDFSEGNVVVDGNNLKEMDQNLYDAYRSSLIGFVFQDFNLINNLTVQENIELALDIINDENKEIVHYILEQVGLSGYEDRYPKELSGGQKQRVAIARCLVKNPKYIFADEPTGNLDYNTSIQILDLLKELAKDRLILIISHSKSNAYKYGDRLIEIADGKIVKDVEKYLSTSLIENDTIYVPIDKTLTDEEIMLVNEKIATGKYKFSQENNTFKPTHEQLDEDMYSELQVDKKIYVNRVVQLSKTFRRNYLLPTIFNSLIISVLLVALLIAQLFFNFDSKKFINLNTNSDMDFVLYKDALKKNMINSISQTDIQGFYDRGYTGNIYKLYSFNVPTSQSATFAEARDLAFNIITDYDLVQRPLIVCGRGVLECDINYLKNVYGENGKLDVLAGSLEDNGECELIITDYLADCLKYYRGFSYSDIVNADTIDMELSKYKVKAIINTQYKTRYSNMINKVIELKDTINIEKHLDEINQIKETEEFTNFFNELNTYLSVAYFTDGNFIDRLKSDHEVTSSTWSIQPQFFKTDGSPQMSTPATYAYFMDETLKPGEVKLGYEAFKMIFGYEHDSVKLPIDFVMTESFKQSELDDEYVFRKQLKVVEIVSYDLAIHLSPEDFYKIYDVSVTNYGLYFENDTLAKNIYNDNKELDYYCNDSFFNALHDVNKIIILFSGIFQIMSYFILLIIAILLINYGRRNIKRKIFEIGVLRSLGAKNKDIFTIIVAQVLLMLVIVVGISIIPILTLDNYINNMLLESFMNYTESRILENITIIKLDIWIVIKNFILILGITLLCSVLLLLMIRKIKPINIIKKEE